MTTSDHEGEPITEEGLAALKAEIGELETVARREMAARILTARGHGDLKENAEYHAAKEDQAHLETRIQRLRQRLRNAVVVETKTSNGGYTFAFGRAAEVRDEAPASVHTWTIVGATEADRAQGKLSAESPVAKALLDQRRRGHRRGANPARASAGSRSSASCSPRRPTVVVAPQTARARGATKKPRTRRGYLVQKNRRRPTLPGPCGPSTIGAEGLNGSVRNGKRCFPLAIATGNLSRPRARPGEDPLRGPSKLHSANERISKISVKPSTH